MAAALAAMQEYGWPGNVRELEHVMRRAVVVCDGDTLRGQGLVLGREGQPVLAGPPPTPAEMERRHIVLALTLTGGVIKGPKGAARLLGLRRLDSGHLALALTAPSDDGNTPLLFAPLALIGRLAALSPPPRPLLIRSHGMLAPHAAGRALIVPAVGLPAEPPAITPIALPARTYHPLRRLSPLRLPAEPHHTGAGTRPRPQEPTNASPYHPDGGP